MCQEVGNLSSALGLYNVLFSSLFFFLSLFFFFSGNLFPGSFSISFLCGILTEDQRADLLGGIRASQGKQDDPKTTEEETKREDVAAAFVRKLLPQLPADCVRFQDQKLYEKPSHLVLAMMTALPCDRQLSEDQTLFMLRFADVLDKVYDEEQHKPPESRGVFFLLCYSVRVVLGRRTLCRI